MGKMRLLTPRMVSLAGLAIGALALLGACTPRIPGATPNYQVGYNDGCDSGYAQAFGSSTRDPADKNQQRYTSEVEYRRGWDDGFKQCMDDTIQRLRMRSGGGGR